MEGGGGGGGGTKKSWTGDGWGYASSRRLAF